MPRGSPAVKLAVTVDADVHARVVEAAEAEGTSVSAWMTAAAWEAEHGALTDGELEAAHARIERNAARRKRSRQ
jgi:hypothetical protein